VTLIIPPGYGNAAFIFTSTVGTPPLVTTLGIDLSNAGGDFVEVANQLMGVYAGAFGSGTDSSLSLDRVNLAVGQDGPGGSVDSDAEPIAMTGSITGPPVSMAPIARKVTNDIGRRGRGRMFLPGVLAANSVGEDGVITSAARDSLQARLDAFYESLFTDAGPPTPFPPVLLHSQAPADPTPITGFSISLVVGWIRGRIR
jgi:hypothetical protein